MEGILYSDFSNLSVDYKILNLSREFFRKTNRPAVFCHVNPKTFEEVKGEKSLNTDKYKIVSGVRVEPDNYVQPNYFHIGEIE